MARKKITAGFIGAGFAARFHYEALQRVTCATIDVAGVFSNAGEKLDRFASDFNVRISDTADDLMEKCDVLHVCTPPATHEHYIVNALGRGKDVIVEKPLTGYFGDGSPGFSGDTFPREEGLQQTLESLRRMHQAEEASTGRIMYAENWVYAPSVQKARELIEKTKPQVLWIQGQQSHSGSHSPYYGQWAYSGGGSLIGKGCHPLSAALYLKRVEGLSRDGVPIRPLTVSARTHAITRSPEFRNEGHIRTGYKDVEDFVAVHAVFEDGTFADLFATEIVLGGIKNWLEVHTSHHRTICNMGPNNAMQAYTPDGRYFDDVYVVEKTETKQGWSHLSPDEPWFNGYQHEMEAFYRTLVFGDPIESNSQLAADVISLIYTAYVSAEQKGKELEIKLLKT